MFVVKWTTIAADCGRSESRCEFIIFVCCVVLLTIHQDTHQTL